MCRLLAVNAIEPFDIHQYLIPFAQSCKESREYQGHGWGCAYVEDGKWRIYKNIKPLWQDSLEHFKQTTLLLVHCRSAFRDEGIVVENNMPFFDATTVFIFNGELQGVRLKEEGRIGAEKIFNYIQRFSGLPLIERLNKALPIIVRRTQYVRAMNSIVCDMKELCVSSHFNEDEDYFTMHTLINPQRIILSSTAFKPFQGWEKISNKSIHKFSIL